jgi:hypothetical protein
MQNFKSEFYDTMVCVVPVYPNPAVLCQALNANNPHYTHPPG